MRSIYTVKKQFNGCNLWLQCVYKARKPRSFIGSCEPIISHCIESTIFNFRRKKSSAKCKERQISSTLPCGDLKQTNTTSGDSYFQSKHTPTRSKEKTYNSPKLPDEETQVYTSYDEYYDDHDYYYEYYPSRYSYYEPYATSCYYNQPVSSRSDDKWPSFSKIMMFLGSLAVGYVIYKRVCK